MDSASETVIVPLDSLHDFIVRGMQKVGAKLEHAQVLAELLVAADHRGHYSHGLNRIDYYLSDVHNGYNSVDKEPEIMKETAATALVNGNNCLGPAVGKMCMDIAIAKAKAVGIGWVCAKGSNHFGIAGWYSMRAMNQGLIGMAFCNTSPNMIPTRSKTRTLGTNPISVAARGSDGVEFILDMATTSVAQGKVRLYMATTSVARGEIELKHRLGLGLPDAWGVDRNGKACKDTEEVLYHGGLCPLGGVEETSGYKGFGLGLMVELFCGILSGSQFGMNIRDWKDHNSDADLGQCFVALDPSAFAPGFEGRLSELISQCKEQEPAEGETEILVAGDPEAKHIQLCAECGGIPYHLKQVQFADMIAEKYGFQKMDRLKKAQHE